MPPPPPTLWNLRALWRAQTGGLSQREPDLGTWAPGKQSCSGWKQQWEIFQRMRKDSVCHCRSKGGGAVQEGLSRAEGVAPANIKRDLGSTSKRNGSDQQLKRTRQGRFPLSLQLCYEPREGWPMLTTPFLPTFYSKIWKFHKHRHKCW